MIIIAVLKHIAIKNADYKNSLNYLLFKHNELTNKPIRDEYGRMQLRDEYYIDGILCEPMSFDLECMQVNKHFRKNQKYDEIKQHHYIISFDPRDATECGLTGERAQALCLEYAKNNFPGHQALVVTHTDGHNGSGNIHTHIVLNSVRKIDVPEQDFMERFCDHKAGYKHHQTNYYLRHLKKAVMEMCEKEGLHQTDLLSPAERKITQAEYWATRRGQKKLDDINKEIIADGLKPKRTTFQTQKEYIRSAVDEILKTATTFEEFNSKLYEKYKITLNDKRGRYSYLHPERNKYISERTLGANYGKDHVLSFLQKNQLKRK